METEVPLSEPDLSERRKDAVLALELVLLLALAFAATFLLKLNGARIREAILLGTLALACFAAISAVRRSSRSRQAIWLVVATACALWLGAEGGRLIARAAGAGTETSWLISGVLTLTAYSLILLALARMLAGSSLIAWSLVLLDMAIVAVALCSPWLELVVLPRLQDAGGAALFPQLLAPVLAAVVVVSAALAVQAASVRTSWSYLLLAALGLGLAGDLLVARHLLSGGTMAAALGCWQGRALLVIVAAALIGGLGRAAGRRLITLGVARMTVVVCAYSGALAFAAIAFERGDQVAGFTVVGIVSALLLLHLIMHAIERHDHSVKLEQALREQERLAVMDSVTGLYNRRFLDAELQLELDRGARSQQPVGILLCDIDHFKQVNDRYGHLVGDVVLREVARRLLCAVRNGDLVARYGGEEFVVLLPGGDKELLREIGERCRRAFEETPFLLPEGRAARITISIGGACWPGDAIAARELLEVADSALYRAKERGRNCVHVTETETGAPFPGGEATGIVSTSGDGDVCARSARQETSASAAAPGHRCGSMERRAVLVEAERAGDEQAQRRCALAARYHDIGKSALPESILAKNGPLTGVEWELVQEHSERGATLVELAPELKSVATIIREHHERFDGRGYPCGKSKDEISPEARIVACCDAWYAMRSDRPYSPAKTVSEARAELLAGRGTQFDPNVVMAFLMVGETELGDPDDALAPV